MLLKSEIILSTFYVNAENTFIYITLFGPHKYPVK